MYGLPPKFSGEFLLLRTLEYVSFSPNTVQLVFDQAISITVLASLQHLEPTDVCESAKQTIPLRESRLMQIIGSAVTMAHGDETGTLTLGFANGHVLRIFDDSKQYESYLIRNGQAETYV
jgi:hypothetical protein